MIYSARGFNIEAVNAIVNIVSADKIQTIQIMPDNSGMNGQINFKTTKGSSLIKDFLIRDQLGTPTITLDIGTIFGINTGSYREIFFKEFGFTEFDLDLSGAFSVSLWLQDYV